MCQISPFNFCNVVGGPLCSIWGEDSNENGIAKERTLAKLSRIAGQAWKKLIIFWSDQLIQLMLLCLAGLEQKCHQQRRDGEEKRAPCQMRCTRWTPLVLLTLILLTEVWEGCPGGHFAHGGPSPPCKTLSNMVKKSCPPEVPSPRSQPCVNPLLNHRFLGVCLILGGGIVGIVWDGMMSNIQRYWLILVLDNLMQFFCALLVFKCF